MFIYQPNLDNLLKAIFQSTGVVYINKPEEIDQEFVQRLEAITAATIIKGYIFRDTDFKDFTKEDWANMYLQYECTYGAPSKDRVAQFYNQLAEYSREASTLDVLKLQATDANKVTIEPEIKLLDYIQGIFESKIPLRDTQLRMIYQTPIDILEACYHKSKFVIKESRNIVLTILFQEGGKDLVLFKNFDDIVRFVVSNYGYIRDTSTPVESTKLDKTILSKIDLRIPTAIKKVILGSINKIKINDKSVEDLKKYQQFWKRIFQQLAYTTEKRMSNRFPFAFEVKEKLYEKKCLHTDNTEIEHFRKEGDLGTAFSIELGNPGKMIRRLLSYLRYKNGSVYARKEMNKLPSSKPVKVKDDITDILNDTMFDSALYRTSPKLLLKMLELLNDEEIYKDRKTVKVYSDKVTVNYQTKLPGVNKVFAQIVIEKINKVLDVILKERNESLGKVFLDLDKAFIPVQFSGRLDSTDAISGGYYPSGSVIQLQNIIDEALKKDDTLSQDDIVLRIGLAWKGEKSTDLDLSTNLVNSKGVSNSLYFGNPTFKSKDDEVIGVSSGDITRCDEDRFSAELIDFKYEAIKKEDIKTLFNVFQTYSGAKAKDLEVYFFVEVITADKMVEARTQIYNYDLSNAVLAIRSRTITNFYAGVKIDLDTDTLTVISKDIESSLYDNICRMHKSDVLDMMSIKNIYINKLLARFIEPEQVVDSIEDADTVITTNQYLQQIDGKKVYNLATQAEDCQDLYM